VAASQFEIRCQKCDAREVCGPEGLHRRLYEINMLRRAEDPDVELLVELFRSSLPRMACAVCGQPELSFATYDAADQDQWGDDRACSECGATIPPERVELFPNVELCVACQRDEESGKPPAGSDRYCPRCGAILLVKPSGQGITRYVLRCSECTWKTG
jgi:DNA-directed RNA polymerase subunit RPC12/RpoP